MDKILSAEEWFLSGKSKSKFTSSDALQMAQAYSTYLLDKFAKEVKSKGRATSNCPNWNCEGESLDQQSIDQLLTEFKEKL
jgi:hypothetical protein